MTRRLCVCLAVLATASCRRPSAAAPPPVRERALPAGVDPDRDLVVDENVFRFRGRELRLLDRVETWKAVLGSPSRTSVDATSLSLTWDDQGMLVGARSTPDGRAYVCSVHVALVARDVDPLYTVVPHSDLPQAEPPQPRAAFPGRIAVEGAWVGTGPFGCNDAADFFKHVHGVRDLAFSPSSSSAGAGFEVDGPDISSLSFATTFAPRPVGAPARFCELEFETTHHEWSIASSF